MDYVFIFPMVKISEEWTRSTSSDILKEVCRNAIMKFNENAGALILMEFGGVYAMLQKDSGENNGLIFMKL